jgi:hypothetical protein
MEHNTIVDHPKLFDTFFGQVTQPSEIATAVFEKCKDPKAPLYTDGIGWTEWPAACEESGVLLWLRNHISKFLQFADEYGYSPSKRRRCITTPNKPLPGSVGKRKLDVGLAYEAILTGGIRIEDDGIRCPTASPVQPRPAV